MKNNSPNDKRDIRAASVTPHVETLTHTMAIMLDTIGSYLRPRPNFHSNTIDPKCWRWRGAITKAGKSSYTRFTADGRTQYQFQTRAYPVLRLASGATVFVHRFIYLLMRQPTMPVTTLKKVNCLYHDCINPWHWEAAETGRRTSTMTLIPETSPMASISDYLSGALAEDEASMNFREMLHEEQHFEWKNQLGKTHAIIPRDEYKLMQPPGHWNKAIEVPQAALLDENGKPYEMTAYAQRNWFRERDIEGNDFVPKQYYMEVDMRVRLKEYVDKWQMSELVQALVREASIPLPQLKNEEDYWIAGENVESGTRLFFKSMKSNMIKWSDIITLAKSELLHPRLILLGLKECRPIDIRSVDWNN